MNEMKRFLLDTNVFLRVLLNDLPSQADQVEKFIKEAKRDKVELLVPQIIVFEIVFALEKYYQFRKEDVIDKIKTILAMDYLKIQDRETFNEAISLFGQGNLSLTDCFLIQLAEIRGASIFTFDKDMKRAKKN